MKFLVTGSAGLVGRQVIKDLVDQDQTVYSCYNQSKPEVGIATHLDLTNPEQITKTVENTKPDAIIHLAAMTNVDLCETKKDLAMLINADATQTISTQAAKHGAFFVYVSTDYVFDGKKGMKKETDSPNPLGFYGKSKLEGENRIQNLASSWCIARTSTPFGLHPKKTSFPVLVAQNLQNKQEVKALSDQYTSPTFVQNLSKMLIEIATRQITGIIHLAGASRISRYETASLLAEKLNLDKTLVKSVTINQMNWKAQRPADSSLDVSLATQILNEKPQEIKQSLDLFIDELKSNY